MSLSDLRSNTALEAMGTRYSPELSTSPPPFVVRHKYGGDRPSSTVEHAPTRTSYQRSTNSKHGAQVGTSSLALGPRAPSGHLLLCELSSSWVGVEKLSMTKSAISRPNF